MKKPVIRKRFLSLLGGVKSDTMGNNTGKIVLTEKKMDFLLGNKRVLNLTNSVPTPSAQYTTLCDVDTKMGDTVDSFLGLLCSVRESNAVLYAVGWLLLTYGLRVSEVLEIRYEHLRSGQKIWIGGKKRSGDRYVNYSAISSIIGVKGGRSGKIFYCYSRFWVYRELKKIGICLSVAGNKKKSVTHAGRHLNAQELSQSGDSVTAIQGFYQHKSVKSTKHYVGKEK